MSTKKAKGAPKATIASAPTPATAEPTRGVGRFYYQNGATYDGEWMLDANADQPSSQTPDPTTSPASTDKPRGVRLKDGKGVFKDGEYSYEGDWTRDLANGEGAFKFASGAVYQGQWKMGSYCGIGTYKWPDGRSYTGEWRDNKMHGNGVYVDKDGHKWTGQFFNGSGPGLTCEL